MEFTQLCVQSLFRHTRRAWELIVVDNGSTDDTADYLNGVRDASATPVTVVKNAHNRGFPAAINQGLQKARGEYLVLLNNDAVVTDGWLDQLIALTGSGRDLRSRRWEAGAPDAIGLVGPMSNYASPPQRVENVPYRDLDEMHAFAGLWRDEHRGKWFTVPKLSGFCLLDDPGRLRRRRRAGRAVRPGVLRRRRPGRAGASGRVLELAVAHDLFVHHFGSRTFVGNGIDAEALLDENARRFADKWGHETPRPAGLPARPGRTVPRVPRESSAVRTRLVNPDECGRVSHRRPPRRSGSRSAAIGRGSA